MIEAADRGPIGQITAPTRSYSHVSFKKDGEVMQRSGRHTLVFLKTVDGWKIIHEHGTPKMCFEQK